MSRVKSRKTAGPGNGAIIEAEIAWFTRLLDLRFRIHGGELAECDVLAELPPPLLPDGAEPFAQGARDAGLGASERLALILALLPLLRPQALDPFLIPNSQTGSAFTEFGGAPSAGHSGFRPTRETALFLLAGESMERRIAALPIFAPGAPLQVLGLLEEPAEGADTGPWTPLLVSRRWLERLTLGRAGEPRFGAGFPAQRLETAYRWDDLVLPEEVRDELDDLVGWVENERRLMGEWGLARHVKPGYRALFYGPPGTGKTVTAAALGRRLGLPVYRVDLSRVVSKWIGETEKNLGALFDEAAFGRMILFFDEADALFGKRGETRSANDQHANQQIAYLLQRIEESQGVTLLASNLKANIDPAFARRLQATIYFSIPDAAARLALWRAAFAPPLAAMIEPGILERVAREYELAGGSIINVLRYCASHAARAPGTPLPIEAAVRRELAASGAVTRAL